MLGFNFFAFSVFLQNCVLRRRHVLLYFITLSASNQFVQALKNLRIEKTLKNKKHP